MKSIIISLMLLVGFAANGQTTKIKTKTVDGKTTRTIKNGTTVITEQERVIHHSDVPQPSPLRTTVTDKPKLGIFTVDDAEGGALVQRVDPSGPAADAGLREGDVIVKVNDNLIGNASELLNVLADYDAGDRIRIGYERRGQSLQSSVLLGTPGTLTEDTYSFNPEDGPSFSTSSTYTGELPRSSWDNGGRMTVPYDRQLGIRGYESAGGLRIFSVRVGSAAYRAGLQTNDLISRIDGIRTRRLSDIGAILQRAGSDRVEVEFLRRGRLYHTELRY